MERFLGITLFLFSFAFCSRGLALSLTKDQISGTGSRSFCGVLVCAENTRPPTSDNDTLGFNSILSMSIFKKAQSIPVASVTKQQSNLTRVADGMKIAGFLDSAGASIRIELVKVDDCEAEFSCEVRGVTRQGREAVIKDSFEQHCNHQDKKGDVYGDRLIPTEHLQLLTSVTQLITQSMARQEDRLEKIHKDTKDQMDTLEDRLEKIHKDTRDQMDTLEDRLEKIHKDTRDQMDNLEDRLEKIHKDTRDQMDTFERHLEDKLSLFENRVEDKIDNNNNLNKLIQLDVKVSTALEEFRAQTKQDIEGSLVKITKEMKEEQKRALEIISENIVETQNKTFELSFSMRDDLNILKTYGQTNLLTTRNETARIQESLTSQENICRKYQNDTINLNYKILKSFQEFKSITKNVSNSKSELKGSLSELEQRLSQKIKTLREVIVPMTCKKGMFPVSTKSGFYHMTYTEKGLNFPFMCDTITDNGGWILIQRRVTGNVNFDKSWVDYRQGFGSIDGDFWLGNDIIHSITKSGTYELRVELRYKDKDAFAHYDKFSIADENNKYKLTIGSYDGTAGDSLRYHNDKKFSTADADHDSYGNSNCAKDHGGGWWFGSCDEANLNGHWGVHSDTGVEWQKLTGSDSASYTEMKIRQV